MSAKYLQRFCRHSNHKHNLNWSSAVFSSFFNKQRQLALLPTVFKTATATSYGYGHSTKMTRDTDIENNTSTTETTSTEESQSPIDAHEHQNENEYELIYESSLRRKLYPIKILSISGCIGSLLLAPFICFDPMQLQFLSNIGMMGRCFLGIPIAVFGCGTSVALHLFSKTIVTRLYAMSSQIPTETPAETPAETAVKHQLKLEVVTIFLQTLTIATTLQSIKCLPPSLGFSNCIDHKSGRQLYINSELLPDFMNDEIGFNETTYARLRNSGSIMDSDTSWMGKE